MKKYTNICCIHLRVNCFYSGYSRFYILNLKGIVQPNLSGIFVAICHSKALLQGLCRQEYNMSLLKGHFTINKLAQQYRIVWTILEKRSAS